MRTKGGGSLLLLPPIKYDEDIFLHDAEEGEDEDDALKYWTPEALKFGKRLVGYLVALFATPREGTNATPAPEWANTAQYRLTAEREIEADITEVATKMAALQQQKAELERRWSAVARRAMRAFAHPTAYFFFAPTRLMLLIPSAGRPAFSAISRSCSMM